MKNLQTRNLVLMFDAMISHGSEVGKCEHSNESY